MRFIPFLLCLFFISIVYGDDNKIKIEVKNTSSVEQKNVIVSMQYQALGLKDKVNKDLTIIDKKTNDRLPSQLIDENLDGIPDVLLFMCDFQPQEVKLFSFSVSEKKTVTEPLVNVKYVLPRKDVAWENDRIAYRIYGSPLAGDVLNGIDVWVKRVRYQIIDKWYGGDSLKGKERISYHIDHGEGADFFLVGKSLGCGSSAILFDNKIYQAGLFSYYRIIAKGPLRIVFEVYYPDIVVQDKKFLEIKRITLDAGTNLNKIEDVFISEDSGLPIEIVCGLVKRSGVTLHKVGNIGISLWGPTDTEPMNEFLGTGIIVPENKLLRIYEDSLQVYAVCSAITGQPFTYYTGAGWTRSGDFKDMDEWNQYLESYLKNIEMPLVIRILK